MIRRIAIVLLVFASLVSNAHAIPPATPWDIAELDKVPQFEWIDADGPVRSLFYAGEPYQGHATRVFAYYADPSTLGNHVDKPHMLPAVVLVHGGGGSAFREWVELWAKHGYAAIAMDLGGMMPLGTGDANDRKNRAALPDGGPDQTDAEKFGAIDKPLTEQWEYHAVANVIRAHSLIRSFDLVDTDRTAVTGISWGGYLTCIVAGVDARFKAAVPVYGCGYLHENSVWLPWFNQKFTPQQRDKWVNLWDPSRYLPAVSMPILFVDGTNDFAYPLDSLMKSVHTVPRETYRNVRVTVNMPHSHPAGWAPPEIARFIDARLMHGPDLAKLDAPVVMGQQITCKFTAPLPLTSAVLNYTIDDAAMNKHKWITVPATIEGDHLTAPAPPAGAKMWFFNATDQRGDIVSSEAIFADPPTTSP